MVPLVALTCAALCGLAGCCDQPCSLALAFEAPVPDQRLAPGDTASYALVDVWTLNSTCPYGSNTVPPRVELRVEDAHVVTAEIRDQARLFLRARRPGRTRVLLKAEARIHCETLHDATHFTVTVAPGPSR